MEKGIFTREELPEIVKLVEREMERKREVGS